MKEDIIKLAREAGILPEKDGSHYWIAHDSNLQCFAAIVADRCAEIAYEAEPFHSADLIRKAFGVEK
jgi:hypothetical protein